MPRFAERFLLLVEVDDLSTSRTPRYSLVHLQVHLVTLVRHTCNHALTSSSSPSTTEVKMESTLREYISPRKQSPSLLTVTLRYVTLPFADMIQHASIKCKQSPVYGVFDRYFHIPLPNVTKHELGLPFPHRNLPIKFGTNPSTIF